MPNIYLTPDRQSCTIGDQSLNVGERYLVSYYVEIEAFGEEGNEVSVITDAGIFSIENFLKQEEE